MAWEQRGSHTYYYRSVRRHGRVTKEYLGTGPLATQKSEDSFTKQISALDNKIGLITEQSKSTMTRQEVEQLFRTIMDKLDGPTGLAMRLENMVARSTGRDDSSRATTASNQWAIGAVLGGLALLIALTTLIMKLQ